MGGERIDDLVDREPDLLELAGQPDPVDVAPEKGSVTAGCAGRLAQEAAAFVEADRVD